jgi:glycosyltransferase involved in cell wall biosynthesis
MMPALRALPARRQAAELLHRLQLLRLGGERLQAHLRLQRPRVVATACWGFPIYSQTFVYQELTQLMQRGVGLRFLYAKLNPRDELPAPFSSLWPARRKLLLRASVCREAYAYYLRRMPEKVAVLTTRLCRASGLSPEALRSHKHFLQAFSFTRMVEAYRPDYLHSYFFYEGTLFTLVASYLLDLPRGVSCYADHMLDDYELKLVPLHLRQCDLVIATSERIKQELLAIGAPLDPARILVKPNAIDVTQFPCASTPEPAAGEPYRLTCVSRIEPKKGLLHLVDALPLLAERGLPVELHLIGGVDDSEASRGYAEALRARIAALKLEAVVRLHGRKTGAETKQLLQASHAFVAPFVETEAGDKDGIPTAVLEAMATGLPVVATDAGSIPEVLTDGEDGVIVPQRDPQAIAAAVADLLRDPGRRAALGRGARRTIESRFEVSRWEPLFHQHLLGVVAAGRSGRRTPEALRAWQPVRTLPEDTAQET